MLPNSEKTAAIQPIARNDVPWVVPILNASPSPLTAEEPATMAPVAVPANMNREVVPRLAKHMFIQTTGQRNPCITMTMVPSSEMPTLAVPIMSRTSIACAAAVASDKAESSVELIVFIRGTDTFAGPMIK